MPALFANRTPRPSSPRIRRISPPSATRESARRRNGRIHPIRRCAIHHGPRRTVSFQGATPTSVRMAPDAARPITMKRAHLIMDYPALLDRPRRQARASVSRPAITADTSDEGSLERPPAAAVIPAPTPAYGGHTLPGQHVPMRRRSRRSRGAFEIAEVRASTRLPKRRARQIHVRRELRQRQGCAPIQVHQDLPVAHGEMRAVERALEMSRVWHAYNTCG